MIPATTNDTLSPWWKIRAIVTMVIGFSTLVLFTVEAYHKAPLIPVRVLGQGGAVVFTSDGVAAGQQVFLKYGLMANETIRGYGGYLGPDFSTQYLHNRSLDIAEQTAQEKRDRPYADLHPDARGMIDGAVALKMKKNRYDTRTGVLAATAADAASFKREIAYWTRDFVNPAGNGGLTKNMISDPEELRQLTSVFSWTARASTASRPRASYSYTNNFPYDPRVGNQPTGGAILFVSSDAPVLKAARRQGGSLVLSLVKLTH